MKACRERELAPNGLRSKSSLDLRKAKNKEKWNLRILLSSLFGFFFFTLGCGDWEIKVGFCLVGRTQRRGKEGFFGEGGEKVDFYTLNRGRESCLSSWGVSDVDLFDFPTRLTWEDNPSVYYPIYSFCSTSLIEMKVTFLLVSSWYVKQREISAAMAGRWMEK